jgi:hypothetical protein
MFHWLAGLPATQQNCAAEPSNFAVTTFLKFEKRCHKSKVREQNESGKKKKKKKKGMEYK